MAVVQLSERSAATSAAATSRLVVTARHGRVFQEHAVHAVRRMTSVTIRSFEAPLLLTLMCIRCCIVCVGRALRAIKALVINSGRCLRLFDVYSLVAWCTLAPVEADIGRVRTRKRPLLGPRRHLHRTDL